MPSPKPQWPKELIRPGRKVGSKRPDYIWWQELPAGTTLDAVRSVGYEVVSVIPTSEAEKLARAIEKDLNGEAGEMELRAALNHYRTLQGGER